ncbi:hypothetical protein SD80_018470 [Scytonema tolypothrichoides VB-61278]|nr:hypothetical protein SD80_018470 [Scytonema tolypothrichoides VB-61278]
MDHQALLEKLNTFPTIRRQIRAWLKAGVMDGGKLFPTSEGTPQGGVISPLLANIALHGMENRIKQAFPRKGGKNHFNPPNMIRYADDFVILHEDLTVVQRCQQIISEWLKGMGLELKPSKTRLAHTLHKYEKQKPGFDFLGFNIKQYPVGKYQSGKNTQGTLLGFKTLIKPSPKKLKIHAESLRNVIKTHKAAPQEALIHRLNPIIRGWANYYSTVVSKEIFNGMDNLTYLKLRAWSKRRHPQKNGQWISRRYWLVQSEGWTFATKGEGKKKKMRLIKHSETPIVRHVKVQGERSPYDGDWIYWSTRMGMHPEATARVATLLKKQKGTCAHCGLYFKDGDLLEVDHKTPRSKGGKNTKDNLQLLHRHCHDTKTAKDKAVRGTNDNSRITEEPYEVKVSRTVL